MSQAGERSYVVPFLQQIHERVGPSVLDIKWRTVPRENAKLPVQDALVLVRVVAARVEVPLFFDLFFNCGKLLLPMLDYIPKRGG